MIRKIIAAFLSLSLLAGCAASQTVSEPEEETGIVITNNANIMAVKADLSGYQWLEEDNGEVFLETSMREAMKMFTENGSGILYFGYVGCPWCERAIPVLYEAALESGVNVYYVDVHNTDVNSLDDYYALEPYIQEVFELDSDGEPVFKVPEVIGVKNGEIVGHHLALVSGFKIDSADVQMNDEQKAELKNDYLEIFRAAAD